MDDADKTAMIVFLMSFAFVTAIIFGIRGCVMSENYQKDVAQEQKISQLESELEKRDRVLIRILTKQVEGEDYVETNLP